MKIKLLIVICIVMPYFIIASDVEDASSRYQKSYLLKGSEEDIGKDIDPSELEKKSVLTSMQEKVPTITLTDEHKLALHNASIILAGLCTTFGNAVGRLLLMGFFTHKSFKNLRKLLNGEAHRSEHAAKTVCYFVAMLLLAQDGYAWLLKQDNGPIV